MIPLYLDEVEVASLLVYPASERHIWQRIKVPIEFKEGTSLVAALVPWKMNPATYSNSNIDQSFKAISECENLDAYATSFLQFPSNLRALMSRKERRFCVWSSSADSTNYSHGWETRQLLRILKKLGGKDVGFKQDVDIIFVHVGALKSLYQLPVLAERRMKRFDCMFYTYGTHPSVPKSQWGVREIYPIGMKV